MCVLVCVCGVGQKSALLSILFFETGSPPGPELTDSGVGGLGVASKRQDPLAYFTLGYTHLSMPGF